MNVYCNPEIYDIAFPGPGIDIEYYKKKALDIGGATLEIACGTGRIINEIANVKKDCFAFDLSKEMINLAKQKANNEDVYVNFIVEDMTSFELKENVNFAFIANNSLLHLRTDEQLLDCFLAVKRCLTKNGFFAFNTFIPSEIFLHPSPGKKLTLERSPAQMGKY